MKFFKVKRFNVVNELSFAFYFEFENCLEEILQSKIFTFTIKDNQKIFKIPLLNIELKLVLIN